MKILLVTPFLNYSGGVESVNEILKMALEEDGHIVDFLTSEMSTLKKWNPSSKLIGMPAKTAHAFKEIDNEKYDLVITNGEFSWGIDHPRTICIFHGSYYGFRNSLKSFISLREYLTLTWLSYIQKRASKGKIIVAVSSYIENILDSQGIKVRRVIENSINTNKYYPANNIKRKGYLFVGNYNKYGKGFDVLTDMVSMGVNIDCVTGGKPKALSYPSGLVFLGSISHEEMPGIYQKYKILVFPSRFEASGLVALEAMSCGLPVVMTDVGIGQELKSNIPEFVVELSSNNLANEFIQRMNIIESNYEYFSQLAREYVLKRHSYKQFKAEWKECIGSVVC